MAGGGGAEEANLEYTPTWIVAAVCTVIVVISLVAERSLHALGKKLKKKDQKALYESLLKIKEELMLLGFISLLLVVFQGRLVRWCVKPSVMTHMLPCKRNREGNVTATAHYSMGIFGGQRRLLAGGGSGVDYCAKKGKVPLLSLKAIHDLHIFIFALAVTHIVFSAITIMLAFVRIRQWRSWEESIQHEVTQNKDQGGIVCVQDLEFIQDRYKGVGGDSRVIGWLYSFGKQFYASVTRSDYKTMRLGFIMTHCPGNPKFNFYKYMIRALESDFKKVVGISWYLWIFVVIFLLLNVDGWYLYFWVAFIPLILLLVLGCKLENVITKLANDVAQRHMAIEGQLVIKPSDEHFWFGRPRILLYLLHFILFQNAFEFAFFFWIWTTYGFDSCIMGKMSFLSVRLVIGVFIQFLFSYSTLPLYAIVTQMGSSFQKAIFDEHVQVGLIGWAKKAKARTGTTPRGVGSPLSRPEASLLQNEQRQGEISTDASSTR